jgi:hypothetical protein
VTEAIVASSGAADATASGPVGVMVCGVYGESRFVDGCRAQAAEMKYQSHVLDDGDSNRALEQRPE